ncbi:hypothetical protein D3C80_199430 [compost metagenome]
MANVFFRIAASDFLVHRQARRQRLFFRIRAGQHFIDHARGSHRGLRGGLCRDAGFQHLNNARAPFSGSWLIFHVRIDPVQQALGAKLRQLAVEVFAGLAEEFIGRIPEAKDRKRRAVEFWRFFREQEFMQRDRFFRRFALALRGSNHNNQFF